MVFVVNRSRGALLDVVVTDEMSVCEDDDEEVVRGTVQELVGGSVPWGSGTVVIIEVRLDSAVEGAEEEVVVVDLLIGVPIPTSACNA